MSSRRRRRRDGFRRRDALHGWTLHFGPNMTPMVDVVMVILVFFMASTAWIGSEWFLRAALPVPAGGGDGGAGVGLDAGTLPAVPLKISLDVDGSGRTVATYRELVRVPLGVLYAELEKLRGKDIADAAEMSIVPTGAVLWEDITAVQETCVDVGLRKVAVAVPTE